MQEKDAVAREFFKEPVRFADLINGFVYHGKQVVKAQDVQELGEAICRLYSEDAERKETYSSQSKHPSGEKRKLEAKTVIADVVKEISQGIHVQVVFLENQADVHYVMPVRVMNEEAAYYHREWKRIAHLHHQKKDLRGSEYLSGFSKADKLKPVITIVVYWGKKPWDGPRCLKEVLDVEACSLELQQLMWRKTGMFFQD